MADLAPREVPRAGPQGASTRGGGASSTCPGAKYDMHEDPDGEWGSAWYYDDELIYVHKKFVAIPQASTTVDENGDDRLRPHPDDHDGHHL